MKDNVKESLERTWPPCSKFAKLSNADSTLRTEEVFDKGEFVKDPLVSVLVLTYRHEQYIEECVSSICQQKTDFSFEVLVGEDASPDGTLRICLDLQQRYPKQVKVIYSKANAGLVGNMVRLNNRARGKYIAICEGDDFWVDARKLAKQVGVFETRTDVSLVHMLVWQQYEMAKWTRCPAAFRTVRRLLKSNELDGRQQQRKMLIDGNFIQTPTVMCRKDAFAKACDDLVKIERITHWIPSTDFMLWFFCMSSGKAYFMPEVVAVKRVNSTSLTTIRDPKIVYARILGDKRNAVAMASEIGFSEDDMKKVITDMDVAEAKYNSPNATCQSGMKPIDYLFKRLLITIFRI